MNFQFSIFNFENEKAEIVTALTIGTFIVVTLASIISSVFLGRARQTTQTKASGCALIVDVSYKPNPLGSGQDFTCYVTIDQAHAGSTNISCGWSKNGGWPQDGGRWADPTCNGVNCSFGIRMDTFSSSTTDSYELVGFDFSSGCGPAMGKRIPIALSGVTTPTPPPQATNTPAPTSTPVQIPTPNATATTVPTRIPTPKPGVTSSPTPLPTNPPPTTTLPPGVTPTLTPVPTLIPTATPVIEATASPTPIQGVCPGPAGQQCENLNKCDKQGNCNEACCDSTSDCPQGQTCDIANGACNKGRSCRGPTATPTPISTPPPQETNSPTPEPTQNQLPQCVRIAGSGDQSRFDVVFLPDSYTDMNVFVSDAKNAYSTLTQTNLGESRLNKMNFWADTTTKDFAVHYGNDCKKLSTGLQSPCWGEGDAQTASAQDCGGDAYVIIWKDGDRGPCGNCTGVGSYRGFRALIFSQIPYALGHELCHAIADCEDEYGTGEKSLPNNDHVRDNCSDEFSNNADSDTKTCTKFANTACYKTCRLNNWYRPAFYDIMNDTGSKFFDQPSLNLWDKYLP